jgi:methionine-rich copper-binding protein CopC
MKRAWSTLTIVVLVAAWPSTAWAHARYKDSSPARDATVSQAPSELWVEVTEAVEQGDVDVYDPCGQQVDNGDPSLNLTNDRVTVTMSSDIEGAFLVSWEVLAADGHRTAGEFTFTSSGGTPCPEEDVSDDEPKDEPRAEPRDRTRSESDPVQQDETDDDEVATGSDRARRGPDVAGNGREAADDEAADEDTAVAQDAPAPEERAEPPGIWDGIPMTDFFLALGVAAVIGAGGGRIYAGIMGPRK